MQLNFKKFGEGFPLVILHGLLGSSDNWQTIAKNLSAVSLPTGNRQLSAFIIDQRNHGRSPHSPDFSYELLSGDLLHFLDQQNISKAHLLGHSMGGKAVMQFALQHPQRVEKLIVVDVAPVPYEDGHREVFKALFAVDLKHAASREEVQSVLREHLSGDETTVQFLLKSLQRNDASEPGFRWKFNVESLYKNYSNISAGITSSKSFTGEALFIKGEKSNYINPENYFFIEKYFPNHQLTEIKGAGHWVHADKPKEFMEEVMNFISSPPLQQSP